MMRSLLHMSVRNFGCLDKVELDLAPLNVLVGANGSGKSTLLDVIQFLGDAVRFDLVPAVERRGGYTRLRFRGARGPIRITIRAAVTPHARDTSPDVYALSFHQVPRSGKRRGGDRLSILSRSEEFTFKRTKGAGRRLTIKGSKISVYDSGKETAQRQLLRAESLGLSTLPRLAPDQGGAQVEHIAKLFETFRVYDIDVAAARRPVALDERPMRRLAHDASNLSAFLHSLREAEPERFDSLVRDARQMVPGLQDLEFRVIGGASEAVVLELRESWLEGTTPLSAASYGTIRALAILALLHDPAPPQLTCMEEIDHGLHPHVFDRLVGLMREASERTQLIIATHSPALVNRLRPEELVVCERNRETGGVRIPAVDPATIQAMVESTGGEVGPGELWFSGSLGGVP